MHATQRAADRTADLLVLAFLVLMAGCAEAGSTEGMDDRSGTEANHDRSGANLEPPTGGDFALDGLLERARTERARSVVRRCARGGSHACYELGVLLHGGDGVPRDNARSVQLIEHACRRGVTRACYDMGVRHYQEIEVEQDLPRARRYFEHACDEEMKEGCHMLARMVERGLGGDRDVERANKLFRRSCKLGAVVDCERLGAPDRDASGRYESALPEGATETVVRAARKCDSGLMSGCTRLARAYETGTSVQRDVSRAEYLYRIACDWGYLEACSTFRMLQGSAHRFDNARR